METCFVELRFSVSGQDWQCRYRHIYQEWKLKSWTEYHQEAAKKECSDEKTHLHFVIMSLSITWENVDEKHLSYNLTMLKSYLWHLIDKLIKQIILKAWVSFGGIVIFKIGLSLEIQSNQHTLIASPILLKITNW